MKHIKLFEQFVAEAAIPAPLKKLGKWKPIEADEDLLDGTDYTKVSSFMLNTGTDLDDYGIIVNIYDDKDFSIFFDSAPIALTAHTSMQASRISQMMDEYPLPLSKLNRAELDKIINDLKSDYLGENLEDVNVEPNKKLEKATGYPYAMFYLSTQAENILIDFKNSGHIDLIKLIANQTKEIEEKGELSTAEIQKGRNLFLKVLKEKVAYGKYDGADCSYRLASLPSSELPNAGKYEWYNDNVKMATFI